MMTLLGDLSIRFGEVRRLRPKAPQLGHSDLQMAARYTHPTDRGVSKAVESLELSQDCRNRPRAKKGGRLVMLMHTGLCHYLGFQVKAFGMPLHRWV